MCDCASGHRKLTWPCTLGDQQQALHVVEGVVVVGSRILQVAAALLHKVGELGIQVGNLLL